MAIIYGMQKNFLIIFAVIFAIGIVLIYLGRGSVKSNTSVQKQNASATIGGETFNLEVVSQSAAMAQGLSGRDSIGNRDGMLFMFNRPGIQAFWMKGMKFAIDIIWIRGNKVMGIDKNVPPPGEGVISSLNLSFYPSPSLIDKVIEVKAGTADALKLKTGDTITISFSK